MAQALSAMEESRIIALLARGDTYVEIKKDMAETLNRPVSDKLIAKVKLRNKDNLAIIQQKVMAIEETNALANKQKANKLISKKLDETEKLSEIRTLATQQYLDEEITHAEYIEIINSTKDLTVTELVSVSREMHTQTKGEDPTPIAPRDLQALTDAIKNGDEITLQQIVFKGKATTNQDNAVSQTDQEVS